jgi:hypothetical protein
MEPRMLRWLMAALCVYCGAATIGCDPVRKTRQTIVLRVIDTASQIPAANLSVQLKDDFDRNTANSPDFQRFSQEVRQSARTTWEGCRWFSCVTDPDGRAVADIEIASLDRTRGREPPSNRDITGEYYLVRVTATDGSAETLSIRLNAGEQTARKRFTVIVIQILKPTYVQTR